MKLTFYDKQGKEYILKCLYIDYEKETAKITGKNKDSERNNYFRISLDVNELPVQDLINKIFSVLNVIDLESIPNPNDKDIYKIRDVICKVRKISKTKIVLKSREPEIVVARQMWHYFSHKMTNLSLWDIGQEAGGKNHSTVLHSIKKVINMYNNPTFDEKITIDINLIESKLGVNYINKES